MVDDAVGEHSTTEPGRKSARFKVRTEQRQQLLGSMFDIDSESLDVDPLGTEPATNERACEASDAEFVVAQNVGDDVANRPFGAQRRSSPVVRTEGCKENSEVASLIGGGASEVSGHGEGCLRRVPRMR